MCVIESIFGTNLLEAERHFEFSNFHVQPAQCVEIDVIVFPGMPFVRIGKRLAHVALDFEIEVLRHMTFEAEPRSRENERVRFLRQRRHNTGRIPDVWRELAKIEMPLRFEIDLGEFSEAQRRPALERQLSEAAGVTYGFFLSRCFLFYFSGILREEYGGNRQPYDHKNTSQGTSFRQLRAQCVMA